MLNISTDFSKVKSSDKWKPIYHNNTTIDEEGNFIVIFRKYLSNMTNNTLDENVLNKIKIMNNCTNGYIMIGFAEKSINKEGNHIIFKINGNDCGVAYTQSDGLNNQILFPAFDLSSKNCELEFID